MNAPSSIESSGLQYPYVMALEVGGRKLHARRWWPSIIFAHLVRVKELCVDI
jgi:hypothetical protein